MADESNNNFQGGSVAFPAGPYPYPAGRYPVDLTPINTPPIPWAGNYFPQTPVGADEDEENIFTKKVGGLPVYGWAIGVAVLGAGAYFLYQKYKEREDQERELAQNEEQQEAGLARNRGWSPSRSGFAEQIESFLKSNGIRGVRVYPDADEAARTIKNPSPLITMRVPRGSNLHANAQFVNMCRNEGLKPVETSEGIVGLYPDKGKKAKQWERYIDDLRDEGQKI